jgi:hypothetical protein
MSLLLSAMPYRSFFALSLVAVVAACSASSAHDPRYPRRPPGCALSVYHALPEVAVWDDLGLAQVDCYLDESEIACLGRLHTEACRLGGDILYNVPSKASRPVERGMIYRAQVAHTRPAKKNDEGPAPDTSGPVVPLTSAAALPAAPSPVPPPPADAGGQ